MKRNLLAGIVLGFVIGIFFIPLGFKIAFKNMMFKEITSPFSFEKTVDLIVNRINSTNGWKVTNIIDQEAVIKSKTGVDVGKVKIIKFCNAKYSGDMLKNDDTKYMAVKMPLSIAVYEKSNGKVYISLMNGYLFSRMASGREAKIMEKVVRDIEKILGFLHFRYTIFY